MLNNKEEGKYPNSTCKKLAVQRSADTFMVNQSLVLRINICGLLTVLCSEIRHFAKRKNG